jgi:uncharacterized protein (TIGR02266 family)
MGDTQTVKRATAVSKSASKKAAERRGEIRAPLKVRVDCRDVDVFVSSKIMNISRGGLFVKTRRPPPRDTPLEIEFYLPAGQDPVKATGSVVWINPAASRGNAILPVGVGIHFDAISSRDLKRIEAYIEEARKNDKF